MVLVVELCVCMMCFFLIGKNVGEILRRIVFGVKLILMLEFVIVCVFLMINLYFFLMCFYDCD